MLRALGHLNAFYLWLLGGRRARRSIGEVSLVYYRLGPRAGEPWLVLHGLGATAGTMSPVLTALRGDCRVLAPELCALGGTIVAGDGLNVAQGAEVAARLIEQEFPGRAVNVAGMSLGGWMAVRLALEHPRLVARLVLIDAGGYRDQDWDRIERLVRVRDLPGVEALYRALFVKTPWFMALAKREFLAIFTSPSVTSIIDSLTPGDTFDDRDLGRIAAPSGLIWGDQDGLFSAAVGRRMAAALPTSRFYLLPRCGHAAHWERPRALAAALRDFRRNASPSVLET